MVYGQGQLELPLTFYVLKVFNLCLFEKRLWRQTCNDRLFSNRWPAALAFS